MLSGLATGASWLCYFKALKLGDAARVSRSLVDVP
jgi:transporter family protein